MATLAFSTPTIRRTLQRQGQPTAANYEIWLDSHRLGSFDKFLLVRSNYAFDGDQRDYFGPPEHHRLTRLRRQGQPGGHWRAAEQRMDGRKWMEVGQAPNSVFHDITEHISDSVTLNGRRLGNSAASELRCPVWVPKN